jgi:hypothetical protein
LTLFEKLRAKRHRNRFLAESSSGDEATRRAANYRTYDTAFVHGVDALAAKAPAIFQAIFSAHYFYTAQFGIAVCANLDRIAIGAGFPQVAPGQAPRPRTREIRRAVRNPAGFWRHIPATNRGGQTARINEG